MIKKTAICLALCTGLTLTYAAPSIKSTPLTLAPGASNDYVVDFVVDPTDTVTSGQFRIDIPADITVNSATSSNKQLFDCKAIGNKVVCILTADPQVGKLPATPGFLTISLTAGSKAGSYSPTMPAEAYGNVTPGTSSLGPIVVKSSTPPPVETKYTLTPSSTGTGTFNCTPAGKQAAGTAMTCTATPGTGFEIGTWGGACAATAKTATVCSFKMPAKNEAASVAFVKKQVTPPTTYTVTTDKNITNGSVTCNPPQGVAGTVAACTAKPNQGFKFERWTNCPGTAAGTTCRITLSDNVMDLSAVFSPIPSQPATPSTAAHPVPAVGILGLLAMLASLAGAASLVLRKKQA